MEKNINRTVFTLGNSHTVLPCKRNLKACDGDDDDDDGVREEIN